MCFIRFDNNAKAFRQEKTNTISVKLQLKNSRERCI